jgi:hypothetical protein
VIGFLLVILFFLVVLYVVSGDPTHEEVEQLEVQKTRMVDVEPWGREVKLEQPKTIGTINPHDEEQ